MPVMGRGQNLIAVTGSTGQLGTEICRQLGARAIALSRADMDLADSTSIGRCLTSLKPTAVINTAAYTAVDRAEDEPRHCFQVNAVAVETIAEACRELDCPLVQVSTDHVFGSDSGQRRPWREDDVPGPVNAYGRSKLEGEAAARLWQKHTIVRTCGLYSAASDGPRQGRNFPDTMLALASRQAEIRVVNDQTCTPSYVPHVAAAILGLLHLGRYGTYHVTNKGDATWHEFAEELFSRAGRRVTLTPISTREFGAKAARPAYSVLDTTKLQETGLDEMPDWRTGLRCYLDALGID